MIFTKKALKHASHGDFEFANRKPVKMKSGGHGQENIDYLERNKIAYNTVYQYNNGVRLGNVSIHKQARCKYKNKQCWFPKSWTVEDIKAAGQHVISLKKNKKIKAGKPKIGYYKGVKVGMYDAKGKMTTIYPWFDQRRKIK